MNETASPAADPQIKVKQTAKDSVFCDLFRHPKYLLQLYQALHPEDTQTTEDDIVTVTLTNVLLNQMYNDLGFTVGRVHPRLMILLEAQATWTINVIIRILMYLTTTWKEFIEKHKLNVYSSKPIELPKPELYVIYTGERGQKPEWITLADELFAGDDTFLNVRVKMIYDGGKGDIINQYVTFTRVYNKQVAQYGRIRQAVLETIRICKDADVLKEYLESREKEVIDIMTTLFDQEYAMSRYGEEMHAEGRAEGRVEGRAEGRVEGLTEAVLRMKENGFSEAAIANTLKIDFRTVCQWISESTKTPLC